MEKELIKHIKDWVFDRYNGFNNDDDHCWKFINLIRKYEKEHGCVPMEGWRAKDKFEGSKEFWQDFIEIDKAP